jgi:hypothetical protein
LANKTGDCVYCQAAPATSGDHVPPKSLFRDEDKAKLQLVKVPACDACNNGNSTNETRFRDVIALMSGPADAKEVYEAFVRSLDHETSKRKKILLDTYRNEKGDLVWQTSIHPLLETVIKVAKGLHYVELGRSWPLAAQIEAHIDPIEALDDLRETKDVQHKKMGDPFSFAFIARDGVSIWWLHFHNRLSAIVAFEEPEAK